MNLNIFELIPQFLNSPIPMSYRIGAGLPRPHPQRLLYRYHKNLAVSDFARVGCFSDGFDDLIGTVGIDHDFNFNFRNKIHCIFRTAVNFLMAFLAPVSLDLANGHSLDADFIQGLFDIIKFKGLDDRLDFLHGKNLLFAYNVFWVKRTRYDVGSRSFMAAFILAT